MASAYPTRLESLAREAAFKLKRAADYRTSASILLAECRRRVDEGDPEAHGAAWAEYCRVHFAPYSPSDIATLVRAGSQPGDADGEAAGAAREDAFDRAWAAFTALDADRQRQFLRCGERSQSTLRRCRGIRCPRPATSPRTPWTGWPEGGGPDRAAAARDRAGAPEKVGEPIPPPE